MPPPGKGPLAGLRAVEFAGLGPGPFCGMLLADLGADVVRIDPPGGSPAGRFIPEPRADLMARGRRLLALDLKQPADAALAHALLQRADVLVEGFRPGVMERLGFGPEACLQENPRLVYGRVTGWGQAGPLSGSAGHDIDYLALSGVLHAIGSRDGPPLPPLNLIGDFAGGGMLLAIGILAALQERGHSGRGQVVDAAMVDGAALLATFAHGLMAIGHWQDRRGVNLLDGGAPFYGCYACADGRHVAIGPLEPGFYRQLLAGLGLGTPEEWPQHDRDRWPALREKLAETFRTRTRDEWCRLFEGTDACVAPVLSLAEAPAHPHNRARGTFAEADGIIQPAPAPRFSRTPVALRETPQAGQDDRNAIITDWCISLDESGT